MNMKLNLMVGRYIILQKTLKDASVNTTIYCLGRAILKLSDADLVVFAKGWETARGCKVEYLIASEYGLDIMML